MGAVGQQVLRCLTAGGAPVRIVGALVAERARPRACAVFTDLEALLAAGPDLVVECARQHVAADLGPRVLRSGRSLLVSSVGALAGDGVYETFAAAAEEGGSRAFIPAGALAGIDALAAARHVGLAAVRYTRRAPPSTWVRSGALNEADATSLTDQHIVFDGTAREAAHRYPKNANVAATIALAGVGFDATRVTLLADPAATSNVHVVEAEGEFGRLYTEMSARTIEGSTSSKIVAGSLVRAILSHTDRIVV
jgi:aspartate dehydrogenase